MASTVNRTNVELKYFSSCDSENRIIAVNRTNVELKFKTVRIMSESMAVNRTNVELKFDLHKGEGYGKKLLIAPTWN